MCAGLPAACYQQPVLPRFGSLARARPCPPASLDCIPLLPSATAVGCTVEHEDPRDIQKKIDDGEIVW